MLNQPGLEQALRRAAVRATLAPSVRNTQPWRFVLARGGLEIHADPTRQSPLSDPTGRQMILSCGCALFNARASLAATGFDATVDRYPDPIRPNMVARLTVARRAVLRSEVSDIAELDAVIELRHTNRRRFADEGVPREVVDKLIVAAATEGAGLVSITRPEDCQKIALLFHLLDENDKGDNSWRKESSDWNSDRLAVDYHRQGYVLPNPYTTTKVDQLLSPIEVVPPWALSAESTSNPNHCLLFLGTTVDGPADWLRAGEALERTLLEVVRQGYAVSPYAKVLELVRIFGMREELRLPIQPHVLLRVGRAPPTHLTRRRRLAEVLTECA